MPNLRERFEKRMCWEIQKNKWIKLKTQIIIITNMESLTILKNR